MNVTITEVYVLYYLVIGLGVLVLTFIVSAVCNAVEEWGERRKQVPPVAPAEQQMQAIRSLATIQDATIQAYQAMHDAAGPQP